MLWFGIRTRIAQLEQKNAELDEKINVLSGKVRDLQKENQRLLRLVHNSLLQLNRGFSLIKIIQN